MLGIANNQEDGQKQPSTGILRKRCSENVQKIYRRTPFTKNTSGWLLLDGYSIGSILDIAHILKAINILHILDFSYFTYFRYFTNIC